MSSIGSDSVTGEMSVNTYRWPEGLTNTYCTNTGKGECGLMIVAGKCRCKQGCHRQPPVIWLSCDVLHWSYSRISQNILHWNWIHTVEIMSVCKLRVAVPYILHGKLILTPLVSSCLALLHTIGDIDTTRTFSNYTYIAERICAGFPSTPRHCCHCQWIESPWIA